MGKSGFWRQKKDSLPFSKEALWSGVRNEKEAKLHNRVEPKKAVMLLSF